MAIYLKYQKYIEMREDKYFELFEKDVRYEVYELIGSIDRNDREDLYQEILDEIYLSSKKHPFILEDLTEYFEDIKSKRKISNQKISDCLTNFLKYHHYNDEYNKYINNENSKFEESFTIFMGSGRLRKYIRVIANRKLIKYKKFKSHEKIISLNSLNRNNIELIHLIPNIIPEPSITIESLSYLNKKQKSFLYEFIEDNEILTQERVGRKKEISQQAVSKQIKSIKKKFKKYHKNK